MHTELITPQNFITLEECKYFLKIDHNEDDKRVQDILIAAIDVMENKLNKKIFPREVTYITKPNALIKLPMSPVIKIISVEIDGKDALYESYEANLITKPFKGERAIVKYLCGYYESIDKIPQIYKQIILSIMKYIYNDDPSYSSEMINKKIDTFFTKALYIF